MLPISSKLRPVSLGSFKHLHKIVSSKQAGAIRPWVGRVWFFDALRKVEGNHLVTASKIILLNWIIHGCCKDLSKVTMKGRFLTDSNTKRNLCYFLLIKEIDSSFSATLLEIAYSFNSSFIFQLLSIFKFPHQTGICKLLFVTFYDHSIDLYLYPTSSLPFFLTF